MPSKSRRIVSSESDSDNSPPPPPTRKRQKGYAKPDEPKADMDLSDRVQNQTQNIQNSTYFPSLLLLLIIWHIIDARINPKAKGEEALLLVEGDRLRKSSQKRAEIGEQ